MSAEAAPGHGPRGPRDYASLRPRAAAIAALPTRQDRMAAFIALLWPALAPTGVSWMGFYVDDPCGPEHARLTLGPREPKPACSPIGLHGACGACLLSAQVLVVRDVRELGEGYIACDPRDMSEVVVPCTEPSGACWGVLDLDSHDFSSFDHTDAAELAYLVQAAGLAVSP